MGQCAPVYHRGSFVGEYERLLKFSAVVRHKRYKL